MDHYAPKPTIQTRANIATAMTPTTNATPNPNVQQTFLQHIATIEQNSADIVYHNTKNMSIGELYENLSTKGHLSTSPKVR